MNSRERLLATLTGQPVDRPPVSFYEIGGFTVDPTNPDPYNIYNSPTWQPLLELAESRTDLMRMAFPRTTPTHPDLAPQFVKHETWHQANSRFTRTTITIAGRTLTSLDRRDADVDTLWHIEHLCKDEDDLRAYLQLPDEMFSYTVDPSNVLEAERKLGDRGLIMLDTGDPICWAASLFHMETFTILAFTEPDLFHQLMRKLARIQTGNITAVAAALPGRLWRIYGPEYASEPYLPPQLFDQYVMQYTGPLLSIIRASGGYPRVHCHGRIEALLPRFIAMGAVATDPIEPPPQGNVQLADVRREYGRDLALFGNLEIADIENLPPAQFEKIVAKSIADGTSGSGRGFCLMPSAAPYGRTITPTTLTNYQTMVRLVGA